jgi:hypothetical protein
MVVYQQVIPASILDSQHIPIGCSLSWKIPRFPCVHHCLQITVQNCNRIYFSWFYFYSTLNYSINVRLLHFNKKTHHVFQKKNSYRIKNNCFSFHCAIKYSIVEFFFSPFKVNRICISSTKNKLKCFSEKSRPSGWKHLTNKFSR